MKKIRVGVIGTGWGQLQVEAFRRVRETEVVAVCDADAARAENLAKQYKIGQTFADYRALLVNDGIDLVSIAAPPDLHEPIARAAIDAGKHVLVEKPLALNARAARQILACAESKGIVHAVDFEMRYLPALAHCKELIDEQYLGQLLRVDVTMVMQRPWGEHGNWAADDARGGGVLMELGANFIDILRWWFGDVSAVIAGRRTHFPTIRVPKPKGATGNGFENRLVTGDDAFWCVMQFARGGEALVSFVTGARHDPGWTISAYGEKGTLVVNSGQLIGMRDGDREMALLPIPKRLELGDNPRDPLMWSMVKLAERIAAKINRERDAEAFPDFRDGVAVAQTVEAIRRASDERAWVIVA
ncbi:MAG: Gfo/Idh/MocA family oxidoreductase [Chloroflexota bacterium]|nr:Gfo/Idh/MocA family oxidoreductase [Chloroflexota bacterium]